MASKHLEMNLIIDFILVTSIIGTLLILFLLMKRKVMNQSQKLLSTLFILLLFVIIGFYADLHGLTTIYYICFLFYFTIGYIAGPIFYIYIKSLFQPSANLLQKHWFHFIPALLSLVIWNIPVLVSNIKRAFVFPYLKFLAKNGFDVFEFFIQLIFFLFYCFLSLRLLKNYRQTIKQTYSNLQDKDLVWAKYLIIGSLSTMGINGLLTILQMAFGENSWNSDYLAVFPLALMIIYLGYHGLTQSRVLIPDFITQQTILPVSTEKKAAPQVKHHLSNVETAEITVLKSRLFEVLEKEKPYLNEELTLEMLAALIPISGKKLSALLNHYVETSFYDLINSYRVKEVSAKIMDSAYAHYTLLAIGLDSGFKSKSSFNRIFKKETGFTPSQYKKQLAEQ